MKDILKIKINQIGKEALKKYADSWLFKTKDIDDSKLIQQVFETFINEIYQIEVIDAIVSEVIENLDNEVLELIDLLYDESIEKVSCGIDTIDLLYDSEPIKEIVGEMENKRKILNSSKIKVVIKPSESNIQTASGSEFITKVNKINEQMKEEGIINRLDVAFDMNHLTLEGSYKALRSFLELIRVNLKIKEVFKTTKGIDVLGNIKVRSNYVDVTIYDCLDKIRDSKVRLEYRFKSLNGTTPTSVLDKAISKINGSLKYSKTAINIIEAHYTDELIKIYDKTKNEYNSLTEFVARYREYILTKSIMTGIYHHVGLNGSVNEWIKKYRKGRKLEFITISELKNLSSDVKKSMKNIKIKCSK